MFHTVVYEGSIAATVDTDLAAQTDNIETIQNSHIVPQRDKLLQYAYVGAVTLIRTKVTSPSIRQYSPIQLRPIDTAAAPSSRTPVCDFRTNPQLLKAFEEIQVQATDSAAGPNQCNAVLGLSEGPLQPAPNGPVWSMRGTGSTTVTANAWTGVPITWADSLAQGTYSVIGLNFLSTTAIAARLIFDQQVMRPGCVCGAADATIPHPMFLKGGLGLWGTFNAFRMPTIEVYCTAADTSQEVFLEFVRTG